MSFYKSLTPIKSYTGSLHCATQPHSLLVSFCLIYNYINWCAKWLSLNNENLHYINLSSRLSKLRQRISQQLIVASFPLTAPCNKDEICDDNADCSRNQCQAEEPIATDVCGNAVGEPGESCNNCSPDCVSVKSTETPTLAATAKRPMAPFGCGHSWRNSTPCAWLTSTQWINHHSWHQFVIADLVTREGSWRQKTEHEQNWRLVSSCRVGGVWQWWNCQQEICKRKKIWMDSGCQSWRQKWNQVLGLQAMRNLRSKKMSLWWVAHTERFETKTAAKTMT